MTTLNRTLLASLAMRLSAHPENIATEALLHLLKQHACSRDAIRGLMRQEGLPELPTLTYQSQVAGDDSSIPDLVGSDSEGRSRLVLEAKFWAALTPNQPSTYLQRLPSGVASVLLFVCPESRRTVLWDKLKTRVPDGLQVDSRQEVSAAVTWIGAGHNEHLAVTSWRTLLAAIEAGAEAQGDQGCRADVRQLQGLCERMDSEAFLPVRLGELSQEVGRRVSQMADLVDEAVVALARDAKVSTKNLSTGGSHSAYGRYFRHGPLGGFLQYSPLLWSLTGVTPLWLSIKRDTQPLWSRLPVAAESLRRLVEHSPSLFVEHEDQPYLGILIPMGEESSEVVREIARQVLAACEAVVSDLERGS